MQIPRATAIKLGSFAGVTAISGACHYFGLAEGTAAGLAGATLALVGAGAHALFGDLGVSVIEHLSDQEPVREQENSDLQRLIGETIARILERAAEEGPENVFGAQYLKQAAAAFRSPRWMAVDVADVPVALRDSALPKLFNGDFESIQRAPVLESQEWFSLVEMVHGPAAFREYDVALKEAAAKLQAQFAAEMWTAAQEAWKNNDLASPALTLRLLSLVAGHTGNMAANSSAAAEQLTELRVEVKSLGEAIWKVASRAQEATYPDQSPDQREKFNAIRRYHAHLALQLRDLDARLQQHVEGLQRHLECQDETLSDLRLGLRKVLAAIKIENYAATEEAPPSVAPWSGDQMAVPPCPYRGLAYFGPQDSGVFFGRDKAIAELEAAVTSRALTALVGASGSGKSSVVLAGLAPRLAIQGDWRFTHFRVGTEPDQNPFMALARALVPLLEVQDSDPIAQLQRIESLSESLDSGHISLANALAYCREHNRGKRILLIADQFEEVLLIRDESKRRRFVDALLSGFSARNSHQPSVSLILTLRGDFYGTALLHRPLADALQGSVVNLGGMTRQELREAIERPAGIVKFENGLVDRLLDDVNERPASLPLLQFALREMWNLQESRRMTLRNYSAIGGISGALAGRAQRVFDSITANGTDSNQVAIFRRLFARLVTFGEGAADTRRVVERSELDEDAWRLAQRLANEDNRLVVTGASGIGHETVEVVHEALIGNWPMLTEWINQDRAFQLWLRQLKPGLDAWMENSSDRSRLLSGYPLATAENWFVSRGADFNSEERKYVATSVLWRKTEARRLRRVRLLILSGVVAAVLAILLALETAKSAFAEAGSNYAAAVDAVTATSRTVKQHLLPDGVKLDASLLAKNLLEEPLKYFQDIPAEYETPRAALARLQLFDLLWNNFYVLGDLADAANAANTELEIAKRQEEKDPSGPEWLRYRALAQENIGEDARSGGENARADSCFKDAVELTARLYSKHPDAAWKYEMAHAHERYGDSLRDQRKFPEALAEFREFLSLTPFGKPSDSEEEVRWQRNLAVVHGKIAHMLAYQENLGQAEQELRIDLTLSEQLAARVKTGDTQRGIAVAHERLGFVRRNLHRLPEAEADYKEELEVATALAASDKADFQWQRDKALAYEGLGDVAADRGEWSAAAKDYSQYVEVMTPLLAEAPKSSWRRHDLAVGYERVGEAERQLGEKQEARSEFQKCVMTAGDSSTFSFDPRNPDPSDVREHCQARLDLK